MTHIDAGQPLVSCIMPTYNRREFVSHAIRYFLRQDYANKELIIVDDGNDSIEDLLPAGRHIYYLHLDQKKTIGAKRNIACQEANGRIIVHWDDDDWMAPWRISYQVTHLLEEQADICGLDRLLFYDPISSQSWQYVYPTGWKLWVAGGTLCYNKGIWKSNPFPDINVGEDGRFVWSNLSRKIKVLHDCTFYVAIKHPGNTSPKKIDGSLWRSYHTEEIQKIMGDDLHLYRSILKLDGSIYEEPVRVTSAAVLPAGHSDRTVTSCGKENTPTYSIIMVVHDAREIVKMSTLRTLRHCAGQDARLIVVDNASSDGIEEWLDVLARRNDINLIRCKTNLGHGQGIELAWRRTSSPYIVTLDSDAFPLGDNWLPQLRARLKGGVKIAGIRHHRNYIHPACLMIARKTLKDFDLSFLDEKDRPTRLDVAERISCEIKHRGYKISGLEMTGAQRRGSVSEPVYLGSRYEGLVYHQWYTTRAAKSEGRQVDDVPNGIIEQSIGEVLEKYHGEAREVTVVMGIRTKKNEPQRLQNARASLWSFNMQDLPRWRYRIIVVEQGSQPQLEDELAPLVDRYIFAFNPGPYNRGWAFNIGASLNNNRAGVLCLTDADLLVPCDFLRRGLEAFESGQSAFLPYHEIMYLNPFSTKKAIENCLAEPMSLYNKHSYKGEIFNTSQGGCVWIDANLYHKIGGHDERFQGWGYEDREFLNRTALFTNVKRLQGRLLHLDHPRAPVQDRWAIANCKLYDELSKIANPQPSGPIGSLNLYSAKYEHVTREAEHSVLGNREWENWHKWDTWCIEQIVRDELSRPAQKSVRRCLAEILVQLGDSLLDIGCGPGALWPHLKPYKPRFTWVGVDITKKMLAVARRLFPEIPVHHADAGCLPFDGNSFDLALLRHILEHLPPWLMKVTLREAMRVARRAVILDFYVPPIREGSHRTGRVGDNFLETRWMSADIEAPITAEGWRIDSKVTLTSFQGERDEVWILVPSRETATLGRLHERQTTKGHPKISIIMPTYRRDHTIFRTIKKIQAQTYPDWELIIIDNTGDGLYEFQDPRIRFYSHNTKTSASYARNRGLEYATGDLVCFFDDDDDMFPTYLERFVTVFQKKPETKMVRCGMNVTAGKTDYTYATPECCLRREFATPTWLQHDGQEQDKSYFRRIISNNNWSEENGDIIVIHEVLCKANFDPRGGLRSGNY